MQIIGETKIFKDDRGVYRLAIANKDKNKETGEENTTFMRICVGFKNGLPEVKNQAKINIKNGFLTFFKMKLEEVDENGKEIYKNIPKIMITDFEIVEQGIDEPQKSYQTKQENNTNNFGYEFNEFGDDLPF